MKNVDFNLIITIALFEANNKDRLRNYLTRQSKNAEELNYTLDEFSDGIISLANSKIEYIKYSHKIYLKNLKSNIDNIDNLRFEMPPSNKRYSEYTSEELEHFQDTERKKYLEWAKKELENSKLSDHNKNEYGRLENIIEVINEMNGKSNSQEHVKQMNLDRLDSLLSQRLNKKFDSFKSDLKAFVPLYDKIQIAVLAIVIYENDILHKNAKQQFGSFKGWMKQFCDILGVEASTYKPATIKQKSNEIEQMKSTYYYLFE